MHSRKGKAEKKKSVVSPAPLAMPKSFTRQLVD